jgi:hypothetical protein
LPRGQSQPVFGAAVIPVLFGWAPQITFGCHVLDVRLLDNLIKSLCCPVLLDRASSLISRKFANRQGHHQTSCASH